MASLTDIAKSLGLPEDGSKWKKGDWDRILAEFSRRQKEALRWATTKELEGFGIKPKSDTLESKAQALRVRQEKDEEVSGNGPEGRI